MIKVDKAKVGKVVEPVNGDGGEEILGNAEHGQRNDAAHQEGEESPVVDQGGILTECEQVSTVPGKQVSLSQPSLTFQIWPFFLEGTCQLNRDGPATMQVGGCHKRTFGNNLVTPVLVVRTTKEHRNEGNE